MEILALISLLKKKKEKKRREKENHDLPDWSKNTKETVEAKALDV